MGILVGIGVFILAIVLLSLEIAIVEDKGNGKRSYLDACKRSLLFVIPLALIAVAMYYAFFN
ncbi:hypothetical protein D3H55_23570 [Bacillus salacetis]|uniref:Uncharacterized protein n=1 Tax=Bacillus salacetis TaxID=2315464 RepID=A0A3A1QKY9_9BACI|nr:hypothetical protein [Bacillus salacetis]RIW26568.1 hypothetical protein D3H55_23570 [Bacillus salacetis]